MSVASFGDYFNRKNSAGRRLNINKSSITTVAGRTYSYWLGAGFPGAGSNPSTAVAPTAATAGSFGQANSGGVQRIYRAILCWSANGGMFTIADRLSHQGGLSGTVTTAQTTNLPTAALTRKTSGVGVMMALEIYGIIGTTGTTVTASYTNQAGSSGQATPAATIGNTAFREVGRMLLMPLATGDTGVQAVASVTVLATTGTAGNFGVTLFYPLVSVATNAVFDDLESLFNLGTMAVVETDACLFGVMHMSGSGTGTTVLDLKIGED